MTTFYVATTGNNDNDGLTQATAWRNVWWACNGNNTNTSSGDTILIMPGEYNEKVVATQPGLTVQSYDTNDQAVIWNQAGQDYSRVFKIKASGTYQNFTVHGGHVGSTEGDDAWHYQDDGVVIGGEDYNTVTRGQVTLRNITAYGFGAAGIMVHYHAPGSDTPTIIENCTVYKTAMKNWNRKAWYTEPDGTPGPDYLGFHPGGTSFTRSSDLIIRNNYIYQVWGEGLPFDFGDSNGAADGGANNYQVYGNVVVDTFSHKIYIGEVQNSEFYGNIVATSTVGRAEGYTGGGLGVTDEVYTLDLGDIYEVHIYNNFSIDNSSGIWLAHGYDFNDPTDIEINTRNCFFYNNTIVNFSADTCALRGHETTLSGPAFHNTTIRNNLFYVSGAASTVDGSLTNVTFGRNVWNVTPAYYQGPDDKYNADLYLENPEAVINYGDQPNPNNYRLYSTLSAAIDCSDSQITTDYFGNSRTGAPDTGAHEFNSAAPPDNDTAEDWGPKALDGTHYNTVKTDNDKPGRFFDGSTSFVDLLATASNFNATNGGVIMRVKPDAAGYTDGELHHIWEAHSTDNNTTNLFLIRQSYVNNRIDFVYIVNSGYAHTIPYETSSDEWFTVGMTWNENVLRAYVNGEQIGSISRPVWLASGFDYIRIGSGNNSLWYRGRVAHYIGISGDTPTNYQMQVLSDAITTDSLNTAIIGQQFINYTWHNLRDASDETEPEGFIVDFNADTVNGDNPLTVTFDMSNCVLPSSSNYDRTEFYFFDGVTPTSAATDSSASLPATIQHEFTTTGVYTVTCKIFLEDGRYAQQRRVNYITVTDPWSTFTADFTADTTTPTQGQTVTFNLTGSVIPDGYTVDSVTLYPGYYSLQDTVTDSGPTMPTSLSYTYSIPGTYAVYLVIALVGTDITATKLRTNYIAVTADPATPAYTDDVQSIQAMINQIRANQQFLAGDRVGEWEKDQDTYGVSDAVTMGEKLTVEIAAITINITEAVTVGEQINEQRIMETEAVTLGESQNINLELHVIRSGVKVEQMTVGDTAVLSRSDLNINITQSMTVGETAYSQYRINVTEAVSVTDSTTPEKD